MRYNEDRKELLHVLENQKTVSINRLKRIIHAMESKRSKRLKKQLDAANEKIKHQKRELRKLKEGNK